jgi:hypothetical protein
VTVQVILQVQRQSRCKGSEVQRWCRGDAEVVQRWCRGGAEVQKLSGRGAECRYGGAELLRWSC